MSAAEIRQRAGAKEAKPAPSADAKSAAAGPDAARAVDAREGEEAGGKYGVLEVGRIVVAGLLFVSALSWLITGESLIFSWRQLPTLIGEAKRYINGPISLTDTQLALYNGSDPSLPIYVGLNGSIYDVSASRATYGPGGSYGFFAGRDAARAFVTGCFQEDLTPDLRGVEEMFIPIDNDGDKIPSRGELKNRRARDMRMARKQIQGTIQHWGDVFSGKTGRPYFRVGSIKREPDWLEKLPKRELCAAAKEGRPKREDVDKPPEYKRGNSRS